MTLAQRINHCHNIKSTSLNDFSMTESILRLGAEVSVVNRDHSLYQQLGRYLGASDVPGLDGLHRICFDGKVVLLQEDDFRTIDPSL